MRYQFLHYRYDSEHGLEGPTGRNALRRGDTRLLQAARREMHAVIDLNRRGNEYSGLLAQYLSGTLCA